VVGNPLPRDCFRVARDPPAFRQSGNLQVAPLNHHGNENRTVRYKEWTGPARTKSSFKVQTIPSLARTPEKRGYCPFLAAETALSFSYSTLA
jgi:hypothetical protein